MCSVVTRLQVTWLLSFTGDRLSGAELNRSDCEWERDALNQLDAASSGSAVTLFYNLRLLQPGRSWKLWKSLDIYTRFMIVSPDRAGISSVHCCHWNGHSEYNLMHFTRLCIHTRLIGIARMHLCPSGLCNFFSLIYCSLDFTSFVRH